MEGGRRENRSNGHTKGRNNQNESKMSESKKEKQKTENKLLRSFGPLESKEQIMSVYQIVQNIRHLFQQYSTIKIRLTVAHLMIPQ